MKTEEYDKLSLEDKSRVVLIYVDLIQALTQKSILSFDNFLKDYIITKEK